MNTKKLLSVVVPVFNEIEVIDAFWAEMTTFVTSLKDMNYELIFVDDGSADGSYNKLVEFAHQDTNVRIIKFSRNFGHQIAITAGIDYAQGDAVVVIDADLQDPPSAIHLFIDKWNEGYDVVYGVREKRKGESWFKLITASLFYRILKKFTKIDIPVDVGDFRLMSKQAVVYFRKLRERDRFVRGLVSWVGFKQHGVKYLRDKRYAGKTKYPYKKMVQFAIDGITSFSSVPLKLASWLGFFTSIFAFGYAINILIQKILGVTVKGLATVVIGMLFLGGIQLICLGIIGEYVGRIFNETKQRPMYIVEEIFEGNKPRKNSDENTAG